MADMKRIKGRIAETIYPNGTGAITAESHQVLLLEMVDDINATKADKEALEALKEKVENLPQGDYDDTELKEQIAELQRNKIDKHNDDYYPTMAVGLADNLSGVDVVDSEVNFRRSGGGAISDGVARIEAIKGNSVVWNQCFGNGATNRDYLKWEGNKATINGEFDADNVSYDIVGSGAKFVAPITNHKYLVEIDVISGTISGGIITHYLPFANKNMDISENQLSVKTFVSSTLTSTYYFARTIKAGVIATNLKVMYRVTDLTKAFPNDWQNINTIEEFYARIPMGVDLNAYNEGEVIHMDVQSIESVGVNQWDEEWVVNKEHIESKNYIRVLPNKEYHTNVPLNNGVTFYDENFKKVAKELYPSHNSVFITPHEAYYMKFAVRDAYGTTYNHDICINLSDTSINGKYIPYIKRVEDLSIIRKYFPNGMKSAGTAHDEIRFNKATQKWEYSKGRFKSVDMGTLDWKNLDASNGMYYLSVAQIESIGMAKYPSTEKPTNLVSKKYASSPSSSISNLDKVLRGPYTTEYSGYLTLKDTAYTDVATLKADLQGVILYYESNDWEWEELDAEDQFKDLDYQVWNCGTEKAIAEGKSAPLAADITYGFNAIGKIKELEKQMATLMTQLASLTSNNA